MKKEKHKTDTFLKKYRQTIISMIAFLLAVVYSIGLIVYGDNANVGGEGLETEATIFEYESRLFDNTKVHILDIQIAETDWENLKNTSLQKNYFSCNLTVDGEKFNNVGVRTKGNSTLIQSIAQGWDRQSLVFNFGKFNKSQRYYGLDKLTLYNNACDSTYLKNMVCLDMMREQGIATPCCSHTALYLNGEYIGLYTAMESVDESFAYRNFGGTHGNLYKPEQYDASALLTGEKTNIKIHLEALGTGTDSIEMSDLLQVSDSTVALKYQGENLSLYDEIWNNSIFDIGTNDKRRLVSSLKGISQGDDIEKYLDIDKLAKYFAVNAFVLNTDNYLTNMAHNYYLYENDGKITMLPWDYDQTMGTVGAVGSSGEISEFINTAIYTPLLNTTLDDRPILAAVLGDENGKAVYENTLKTLINKWIDEEYFEKYLTEHEKLIRTYLESDPIMNGSTERFDEAVASLREFCSLRSKSIKGQLEGTIPATASEQKASPETLVNAESYSCPDSGNFIDMLLKNNSDIVLEDVLERLLAQVNLGSVVKNIRLDDFDGLVKLLAEENNGTIDKLSEEGLVKDVSRMKKILKNGVLEFIRPIFLVALSLVVLSGMLIWVILCDKKRRPTARRCNK